MLEQKDSIKRGQNRSRKIFGEIIVSRRKPERREKKNQEKGRLE